MSELHCKVCTVCFTDVCAIICSVCIVSIKNGINNEQLFWIRCQCETHINSFFLYFLYLNRLNLCFKKLFFFAYICTLELKYKLKKMFSFFLQLMALKNSFVIVYTIKVIFIYEAYSKQKKTKQKKKQQRLQQPSVVQL